MQLSFSSDGSKDFVLADLRSNLEEFARHEANSEEVVTSVYRHVAQELAGVPDAAAVSIVASVEITCHKPAVAGVIQA